MPDSDPTQQIAAALEKVMRHALSPQEGAEMAAPVVRDAVQASSDAALCILGGAVGTEGRRRRSTTAALAVLEGASDD